MADQSGQMNDRTYQEVEYLKKNLGPILVAALAEICIRRPADPIEYLGHWLLRWRYNEELKRRDVQNAMEVVKRKTWTRDEVESGAGSAQANSTAEEVVQGFVPSHPYGAPGFGGPYTTDNVPVTMASMKGSQNVTAAGTEQISIVSNIPAAEGSTNGMNGATNASQEESVAITPNQVSTVAAEGSVQSNQALPSENNGASDAAEVTNTNETSKSAYMSVNKISPHSSKAAMGMVNGKPKFGAAAAGRKAAPTSNVAKPGATRTHEVSNSGYLSGNKIASGTIPTGTGGKRTKLTSLSNGVVAEESGRADGGFNEKISQKSPASISKGKVTVQPIHTFEEHHSGCMSGNKISKDECYSYLDTVTHPAIGEYNIQDIKNKPGEQCNENFIELSVHSDNPNLTEVIFERKFSDYSSSLKNQGEERNKGYQTNVTQQFCRTKNSEDEGIFARKHS